MKNEFTFLDILNLMSFCIGLMNLDMTLTQSDKQELLDEIHGHLQEQDAKIDMILEELKHA